MSRLRAEREALEREKAEVEAQKAANEAQAAKLDALAKEVELQKIRLDELVQAIPTSIQPSQELVERLAKLEEASKQKPDLPPEVVSAGDFPGLDPDPRLRRGHQVRGLGLGERGEHAGRSRLRRPLPHLDDPGRRRPGRREGAPNLVLGEPEQPQLRRPDEGTGRPDDPRLRRGRLRRFLQRLPPPARLRPVRPVPRRPDLVHVLGPRRGPRRHRLRGRERRERPAAGPVPLHAPPQPGRPPGGRPRVPELLADRRRRDDRPRREPGPGPDRPRHVHAVEEDPPAGGGGPPEHPRRVREPAERDRPEDGMGPLGERDAHGASVGPRRLPSRSR